MRNYSLIDEIIINIDFTAKTIFGGHRGERDYPPKSMDDSLNVAEKKHSVGLMRVNNVGEVCAQALYQGQALASNNKELVKELEDAAFEEIDHLYWTEQRIRELGGSLSYFNLVWFAGSFSMGYMAGLLGDEWNLGFLAETEYQVTYHLEDYMQRLPENDKRSYEIMSVMRNDELSHAEMAIDNGGCELPIWAKQGMHNIAAVMKFISYRI